MENKSGVKVKVEEMGGFVYWRTESNEGGQLMGISKTSETDFTVIDALLQNAFKLRVVIEARAIQSASPIFPRQLPRLR
jgi:hypothetical protein